MLGIILFICVILMGSVMYLMNYALKSDPSSRNIEASYEYIFEREELRQWVDSLRADGVLKDTIIHSDYNDYKLHALYIAAPQPTNNTALLIHGYNDNAVRMLMLGNLYNRDLGYNVLIPDLTAHGESEGDWINMGWLYRYEVKQWIDVAKDIFGENTNIVIHGISMGASTALMTSGDTLPNNVKCFVADCGYTSVWDQFEYQMKIDFKLPAFPLLYIANRYCDYRFGWNFKQSSALTQVRKCDKPVFFIHGDIDTYVPTWMVYKLFEAKTKGEKELWVTKDTKHAKSYWNYTEEYTKRVKDFCDKYLYREIRKMQ